MMRPQELGARGEQAVVAYYEQAGYEIVDRNWRCRIGELDLVVRTPDGTTVAFCEVKTRSSARFGSPWDAVTPVKQRRLRRLAARWLSETRTSDRSFTKVRFDVAAVTTNGSADAMDGVVEVMSNAF